MKKVNIFILTVAVFSFKYFIYAQQPIKNLDRKYPLEMTLNDNYELFDTNRNINQYPATFDLKFSNLNSITSITKLPYQNNYYNYGESVPIFLSNGELLISWQSSDSIYYCTSIDTGLTWNNPILLHKTAGQYSFNLSTGIQTNTARIIIVWQEGYNPYGNQGLTMRFSDNNGLSWSSADTITSNPNDGYATITQTLDGKLWLFYSRYNSSTKNDIYFRTSSDNGLNWSPEQTFSSSSSNEYFGQVISTNISTLLAIYQDDLTGNSEDYDIFSKTSTDGGMTWSSPIPVLNTTSYEIRPRISRQYDGTLWLIYQLYQPTNSFPDWVQSDLYYVQSFDGGSSWTFPTQFTRFIAYDGSHNCTLVNNNPFISFASFRWSNFYYGGFVGSGRNTIWYGLIGVSQDDNPPPSLLAYNKIAQGQGIPVPLKAYVDDEMSISDVKVNYTVNGSPFGPFQMYDDGLHNDESPGDNIWGAFIGPFNIDDVVQPSFLITDIASNTVHTAVPDFKILPTHNIGNLILNFKNNSQLADYNFGQGSNAYWPRNDGNDYLYMGGLWVAATVASEHRVMNTHYSEIDWSQSTGTSINITSSPSYQWANLYYDDDVSLSPPIGLQIHQKSYQFADSLYDDFIIFEYILENTGINGNLDNVFVAIWLDPDVGDYRSNLGGYDNQRNLIYVYNTQNTPSGYFGIRLLGTNNITYTAKLYGYPEPEPFTDPERYQYMTSGFPPLPTDSTDCRLVLTAQPFNLAVGDTHSVAFGIVMGNGLANLQINADTLESLYESGIILSIADKDVSRVPDKHSLSQNYPNPFNPATHIRFGLPQSSYVKIEVFNILGERVATLLDAHKTAGYHIIDFDATHLASGIYVYRIQAGDFVQSKKMILMK